MRRPHCKERQSMSAQRKASKRGERERTMREHASGSRTSQRARGRACRRLRQDRRPGSSARVAYSRSGGERGRERTVRAAESVRAAGRRGRCDRRADDEGERGREEPHGVKKLCAEAEVFKESAATQSRKERAASEPECSEGRGKRGTDTACPARAAIAACASRPYLHESREHARCSSGRDCLGAARNSGSRSPGGDRGGELR